MQKEKSMPSQEKKMGIKHTSNLIGMPSPPLWSYVSFYQNKHQWCFLALCKIILHIKGFSFQCIYKSTQTSSEEVGRTRLCVSTQRDNDDVDCWLFNVFFFFIYFVSYMHSSLLNMLQKLLNMECDDSCCWLWLVRCAGVKVKHWHSAVAPLIISECSVTQGEAGAWVISGLWQSWGGNCTGGCSCDCTGPSAHLILSQRHDTLIANVFFFFLPHWCRSLSAPPAP